jgi:hypothetical protein
MVKRPTFALRMREKSDARQIRRPVMPGLEPGIQAAPYIIITRLSALDARVKPVHDET